MPSGPWPGSVTETETWNPVLGAIDETTVEDPRGHGRPPLDGRRARTRSQAEGPPGHCTYKPVCPRQGRRDYDDTHEGYKTTVLAVKGPTGYTVDTHGAHRSHPRGTPQSPTGHTADTHGAHCSHPRGTP